MIFSIFNIFNSSIFHIFSITIFSIIRKSHSFFVFFVLSEESHIMCILLHVAEATSNTQIDIFSSLSLPLGFFAMRLRDHPCFSLIRLPELQKSTLEMEITCGQTVKFDFYCSAVGCVKIVKNVKVLNRVNHNGRCKPCGGKQVPLCLDKPLFVLPVDIHDELTVLSNNSEHFDAVMENIRRLEVYRESLDAGIKFWAHLYLKQYKKPKKGPMVTLPKEKTEEDDNVNVSIDDLSSASETGGPVYHRLSRIPDDPTVI
jgi:hypothetical protein